jgi:hypothetical protein
MIDLILRRATGARAAIAVTAFGLGGTLLFRLSPYDAVKTLLDDASLPEETITPPDRFARVLETLGAAGREAYLQFQLWDLLNPILFGIAGAMLLGWLLERAHRASSAWRFVVLLPVALLAADLLENVIITIAVGAFPDRAAIGTALPLVTAVKFGAAITTIVAVVLLALVWLRARITGVPRR